MTWITGDSHACKRLFKALNLPRDLMSASLTFHAGEIATLRIDVPITEQNVDTIAHIVEDEKIMVGGQVALYGRLFDDKDGKIAQDLVDEEDLSEEHY
jgi:hypothetical protein